MVSGSVAHESFPRGTLSPTSSTSSNPTPVHAYIGISYPFATLDKITLYSGTLVLNNIAKYKGPKLLLFGDQDSFVKGFETGLVPRLDTEKLKVETVTGADHFWIGMEGVIVERMGGWLRDVVGLDVASGEGARL
jgi:hypothetical protein